LKPCGVTACVFLEEIGDATEGSPNPLLVIIFVRMQTTNKACLVDYLNSMVLFNIATG
jgi:hypothetical protein